MSAPAVARCVGESARRGSWGGTHSLGRCQRPAAFAVLSEGRHGGLTAPEWTCQPHLGGVVARRAAERRRPGSPPGVTVLPVRGDGMCASCGERPDWHLPGTGCPA